jgi:UDP-N-acetylglucosamine 2-epimerase (non-hydrolysing)
MRHILIVVGTRPEAIKMTPVIVALKQEPWADVCVMTTGQHAHMVDQVFDFFGITPDINLDLMTDKQELASLTARILLAFDDILKERLPDIVLVQGDTTTVMAIALGCFYRQIPVGHVEAGLRTWNINRPFPEEANRVITGKLAYYHFAPTEIARENLLKEGISESRIVVTGNTGIDALVSAAPKAVAPKLNIDKERKLILVTVHRREHTTTEKENILQALLTLSKLEPEAQFLFPVHPNPKIKNIVERVLGEVPSILLCPPLEYSHFIWAMTNAYFIMTDSGGVQEEAAALAKPVLVLRKETERVEGVISGQALVVGTDHDQIVKSAQQLLNHRESYEKMTRGGSIYGDGGSSLTIVETLRKHFSV